MTVELNHTIVWCRDKVRSAAFLAEMLGRPAPVNSAIVDLVHKAEAGAEPLAPAALRKAALGA